MEPLPMAPHQPSFSFSPSSSGGGHVDFSMPQTCASEPSMQPLPVAQSLLTPSPTMASAANLLATGRPMTAEDLQRLGSWFLATMQQQPSTPFPTSTPGGGGLSATQPWPALQEPASAQAAPAAAVPESSSLLGNALDKLSDTLASFKTHMTAPPQLQASLTAPAANQAASMSLFATQHLK